MEAETRRCLVAALYTGTRFGARRAASIRRDVGQDTTGKAVNPRVVKIVAETLRHCTAVAMTPGYHLRPGGPEYTRTQPSIVDAEPAAAGLTELLARYRVWELFPARLAPAST